MTPPVMNPVSPFSLQFRLGSFPVTVEPSFWLVSVLFGWRADWRLTAAWVAVVFASILLHELGHATAARAFGADAAIRLYSFGGLTYADRRLGRWQDVVMSLAGPFAGFLFGGVMWLLERSSPPASPFGAAVFRMLFFVNVSWGLVNLAPVPPLDGGHVLAGVLGPSRRRLALLIGVLVAGGLVAYAAMADFTYMAVLFALLGFRCLGAWQEARDLRPQRPAPREEAAVERGWAALRAGDEREAARLGHAAVSAARSLKELNAARDLLAWVALAEGDARGALSHLEKVDPQDAARPFSWAMACEAAGMPERALGHALAALAREPSEAAASLAVRLLATQGRPDEAERIARTHVWLRPGQREAHLAEVAAARGEHAGAAALATAAFEATGRAEDAYRAALGHARARDTGQAAVWLRRALDAGWDDLEALTREPALAEARAHPEVAPRLARA